MPFISTLRLLWRHRLFVAIGVAVALLVGVLSAYRVEGGFPPTSESRQYRVGVASAAILVDSKKSQVVDAGGGSTRPDVAALSVRARLLANLMAASPLKDQIAARAGVPPDWLIARPPAEGGPVADRTPAGPRATLREDDRRASLLQLHVNDALPIITAEVRAPDAATASRIASASIAALQRYLQTVTGSEPVPDARKLVITSLGAARSATEVRGRGLLFGIGLAAVLSALWCAAIVAVSALVRAWRQSALEEAPADEQAAAPAAGPPAPAPAPGEGGVADAWTRAAQTEWARPGRPQRPVAQPPSVRDVDDLSRPEAPARVQDLLRPEAPLRRVDAPAPPPTAAPVHELNPGARAPDPQKRRGVRSRKSG